MDILLLFQILLTLCKYLEIYHFSFLVVCNDIEQRTSNNVLNSLFLIQFQKTNHHTGPIEIKYIEDNAKRGTSYFKITGGPAGVPLILT